MPWLSTTIASNLYLLRQLLESSGYAVEAAQHGVEALAMARQRAPDVLITDLLMPEMDGYTLLRQWKADPALQHIPSIVYTATYTDPEDARMAREIGADAFIVKPMDGDELLDVGGQNHRRSQRRRPSQPPRQPETLPETGPVHLQRLPGAQTGEALARDGNAGGRA